MHTGKTPTVNMIKLTEKKDQFLVIIGSSKAESTPAAVLRPDAGTLFDSGTKQLFPFVFLESSSP